MPPPSIDFVLPSPTIGLSGLPIVDPPWMPHFKTKVEEVTINQKESVSLSEVYLSQKCFSFGKNSTK